MAHIKLPEGIPGIVGPMAFSPQTAKPMNDLADILLRGANSLTPAERELIATYVSSENDCYFCQHAHGAVAVYHLGGDEKLINDVKANFQSAGISEKLKALLAIPSISALPEHKADVKRCAEWCGDEMRRVGLQNDDIERGGGPSLVEIDRRARRRVDNHHETPLQERGDHFLQPIGVAGEMIRYGVQSCRRHLAKRHDKKMARRRDHAFADRSSVDHARRQAAFVAQLHAEMQT